MCWKYQQFHSCYALLKWNIFSIHPPKSIYPLSSSELLSNNWLFGGKLKRRSYQECGARVNNFTTNSEFNARADLFLKQRLVNVSATWRCIDLHSTLFRRYITRLAFRLLRYIIFGDAYNFSAGFQLKRVMFPDKFKIMLLAGFSVTDNISENNSCKKYCQILRI